MKILFITSGPITWASSRIRCHWPAPYMGADVVRLSDINEGKVQLTDDYDVYIWTKHVDIEAIKTLKGLGKVNIWDCCDPMWWFSPGQSKEIAPLMDGVVCSNQPLADDFNEWNTGDAPRALWPKAICIRDRLEFKHFDRKRNRTEKWVHAPIRFIWFGIAVNRVALFGAWANLSRLAVNSPDHPIQLTVMDDRPDIPLGFGDELPVYHVQWRLDQEVGVMASHDVAVLPPYPGPWGKVKSNNKELTARACNLEVIDGFDYEEMKSIVSNASMFNQLAVGDKKFEKENNVERSAAEWLTYLEGFDVE